RQHRGGAALGARRPRDEDHPNHACCAIVAVMPRAITGIDHAIVGVRRLDGAAETWRRLGFTLSPRGRHYGWGTANYCIMFADECVELLGIVDPAGFTNSLDRCLSVREGLLGLAFATDDAA